MQRAIIAGEGGSGGIVFSGRLHDFPFEKNDGRFIVASKLKDLTLHYHDHWPDIQHLNADLIFDDNSMTALTQILDKSMVLKSIAFKQ